MTEQIVDLIEGVMPGPRGIPGPKGDQGLPGTGAVPADEAVAGYVGTSGSSQTKTALQRMLKPLVVVVAASDSSEDEKAAASVVCSGEHDEVTLQRVIDSLGDRGGTIRLCRGRYHIDGFTGTKTRAALRIDQGMKCTVRIEGPYYAQRSRSSRWDISEGAVLYVSAAALDQLGEARGFVLTGYASDADPDVWDHTRYPGCGLELESVGITLADPLHDVTCVDMNAFTRNYICRVATGVDMEDSALGACIREAKSVGMRSVMQKQISQRVIDCAVYGMRIGYDVGGEHLFCLQDIAIRCWCGWRFYGMNSTRGGHPLTAVECSDEICIVGPIFGGADEFSDAVPLPGVTLINWNREVVADPTSDWMCEQQATESIPGIMRGWVSYQISDGLGGYRSTNRLPFWQPGHGEQCTMLNLTSKQIAPIQYDGMPGDLQPSQMLRGSGAFIGQTGFATNKALARNEFRSDRGRGIPVYWDGEFWRDFLGTQAAKGDECVTCTPGSKNGFEWSAATYGLDPAIRLVVPKGDHEYVSLPIAHATLARGQYEVRFPEADGQRYLRITFEGSEGYYELFNSAPILVTISKDISQASIQLNYSGAVTARHALTITPSIRRVGVKCI